MPSSQQQSQSSKAHVAHKPPRGARPTVLHLSPDLEPGDPARETVDLAVFSQRNGWRALIASGGGLLVNEAERAAVRHTRMPIGKMHFAARWRNRLHLAALIQKERPALIHAHGPEAAFHAWGLARVHRIPVLLDFTQPPPEDTRRLRLPEKYRGTSYGVRVPSQFMAAQMEKLGWPLEHIHVVAPGIDLQWYNASVISAERLQALSRLWRLPEHAAVIVMPMPPMEGSGYETFLRALAKLGREDIYAVLVGENRPRAGLHNVVEGLVEELKLNGKVLMPDYCLDWPAACWLASVVVNPNIVPRGQTIELLAAQAIGRPVIVTDCGANGEMVQGGETAWVVSPDDPDMLAEALKGAIGLDTERRLDLAERTRDFMAEAFPQAQWAKAVLEMYDAIRMPVAALLRAEAA